MNDIIKEQANRDETQVCDGTSAESLRTQYEILLKHQLK